MSHSFGIVPEIREKRQRGQVNLCGACGQRVSASELLCKDCKAERNRAPSENLESALDRLERYFSK